MMKNNKIASLITSVLLLTMHSISIADTLVKMISEESEKTEIWISNDRARMVDDTTTSGFMMIDFIANKNYMIDDEQKLIIDMTDMSYLAMPEGMNLPAGMKLPTPQKLNVKVEKKGKGPTISGFPTTQYAISVNGRLCFEEFLSTKVLEIKDIKRFYDAFQKPTSEQMQAMMIDPCDKAENVIDEKYSELGLPMRTVDPSGKVTHEITLIKSDMSAPTGVFNFPTGYKKVTMKDMIQDMSHGMAPGKTSPEQGTSTK